MIITKDARTELAYVDFSELEVDAISYHIDLDAFRIELITGINVLERDTLWFLLCELSTKRNVAPKDKCVFDIVNSLKTLLYPIDDDEE